MKRAASLFVILIAALALSACGGNEGSVKSPPNASVSQGAGAGQSGGAPSGEISAPSVMNGSGTVGDYDVSIDACVLCKDIYGKPAALVTFGWTNNGDAATSFMAALSAKAFQNGVQCDFAVLAGTNDYNSGAFMKQIEPGTAFTVQYAYCLQDDVGPVKVQVTRLVSLASDPPTVTRTFDIAP